jgi:hypothetical protein
VNSTIENLGVQEFLLYIDIQSFGCIPRRDIWQFYFYFFEDPPILVSIVATVIYIPTESVESVEGLYKPE